jgi:hypothetical protein
VQRHDSPSHRSHVTAGAITDITIGSQTLSRLARAGSARCPLSRSGNGLWQSDVIPLAHVLDEAFTGLIQLGIHLFNTLLVFERAVRDANDAPRLEGVFLNLPLPRAKCSQFTHSNP